MHLDLKQLLDKLFIGDEEDSFLSGVDITESRRGATGLTEQLPRRPEDVTDLAQGSWLAAWRRSPQLVPPPKPCAACGGELFWSPGCDGGPYLCSKCHPPPYEGRAAMWLRLVLTKDIARLRRIKQPKHGNC